MSPLTDFDDLLYPEAPAARTTQYASADMVLDTLELTSTSVTDALSAFEQEDLRASDAQAASRALTKAAWWMLAKLRHTRRIIEDFIPRDNASLSEILVSRAVYELMLSTGQAGLAAERRLSIEEMAAALFGAEFKPASAADKPGAAIGVVARPHRSRYPE